MVRSCEVKDILQRNGKFVVLFLKKWLEIFFTGKKDISSSLYKLVEIKGTLIYVYNGEKKKLPPLEPYQQRFMGGYKENKMSDEKKPDEVTLINWREHKAKIEDLCKGKQPADIIETLPNGAKQSKLDERFDLIDPGAIKVLAQVLAYGAGKYGDSNWQANGGIPLKNHLNHLVRHVYLYLEGDTEEDHLGHVFCRAMMALWARDNQK